MFVAISDILFQVRSLFIEHLLCAGPSSCFSNVSLLNTGNDAFLYFLLHYLKGTWAAVELLTTTAPLKPAIKGRQGSFSPGSNADFTVTQAHSLELSW